MKAKIILKNRYEIFDKIGSGGMAEVYLAYDRVNELNVAVKILKKENSDEKKIRQFEKEAKMHSRFDHKNIVKVYDVGEEDGMHYIVSEYIDGITLKEYIKTFSPIPLDEVIRISQQTLQGLEHAHECGIIHKDIKGQNILLDKDHNVKITDFGIASIIDNDETKTQTLMGTPQYVAPERLEQIGATKQSDIYAVGILMYEMLLGHPPFTADNSTVIIIKQLNNPIPRIIPERNDVPQSLENIVIRATAKKQKNRYQTVDEMLHDIDNVYENEDVERLVLENDSLHEDNLEKTIAINEELDYKKLKEATKKREVNKRRRRLTAIGGISVLVILIGALLLNTTKAPDITMPTLIDKTSEDAVLELELMGITEDRITIEYQAHDFVEADRIIKTDPPVDEILAEDTQIILTVSTGKEKLVLENYENQLEGVVETKLSDLGFVVEVIEEDNELPEGTIIRQSPEAGTELVEGDTVTLYVSTGRYEITVPNFISSTEDIVSAWASENNISLEKVYACNDQFPNVGEIYSQEPAADSIVYPGAGMKISISEGVCGGDVVVPSEEADE